MHVDLARVGPQPGELGRERVEERLVHVVEPRDEREVDVGHRRFALGRLLEQLHELLEVVLGEGRGR